MLTYTKGDLLEATQNIICHQVNVDGAMAGGLALQIANKYPECEKEYKGYCELNLNNYHQLTGAYCIYGISKDKYIANCFTQKPNFETDYNAIETCFEQLLTMAKQRGLTIAIPKRYGAGIAKGNWKIIENIFMILSEQIGIDITIYEID